MLALVLACPVLFSLERCMQGASLVYRKALQPFMRQHSSNIDKYVEMGEKNLRKQMAQLVRSLDLFFCLCFIDR
jgi:hypothetical protein